MFKIYNVKGIEVPIIDTISEDENGYLFSTLGFVNVEKPKNSDRTIEEIIEKFSNEIIKAYSKTNRKIVYRSDEEFIDIIFKYFEKYEKLLDVRAKEVFIKPFNLRNLAFANIHEEIEINSYMKYMEEEIIQLTIYHELCHIYTIKHYNTITHDEDFYNVLYKEFPKEEVERIMSNNS